ncbi:hypothetical protein B0T24DRAFT_537372 [Lasiosphaeria ovina]|uniref:DUF718 domain protein n=1 Tax=Lasiosphaeria ovina TaxID=92902 RepID=A0AAE0N0M0_9PEZI|nr:hypothetical protein B0T24DRAFT_537372 [Lasiosphaeria ovina]
MPYLWSPKAAEDEAPPSAPAPAPATARATHTIPPRERAPSLASLSPIEPQHPGRRFAQIIKLKPEHVAEYKRLHEAVWPEVREQIKECNIQDYSIFHDPGTGILFASFRYLGFDYEADMAKMRANPMVREWWKVTDSLQTSLVPGATSSESGEPSWWLPVEEVFYQP